MNRPALLLLPVLAGAALALSAAGHATSPMISRAAPSRPVLKTTTVSLPTDYDVEYPAGPEVEAANANCRACHSSAMALTQPPLPADEWRKEVRKMITVYKAPIPEDQVEPITRYFTAMSARQAGTAR